MDNQTNTVEQKSMDYKNVFSSEAGKRVLDDLDREGKFRSDLFIPENARLTDLNLGLNQLIRYIHYWIDKKTDKPEQSKVIDKGVQL